MTGTPSRPVRLFDHREGQCRWIVTPAGTPIGDVKYCGAQTVLGYSWCQHHFGRAFNKAELLQRHWRWPR